MATERSAWTDERLDDLAASLDTNIAHLRDDMRGLRSEMGSLGAKLRGEMDALRTEFHTDMNALRAEMNAFHRQITQIGWALATGLLATMVGLVIAVV